MTDAVRVAYVVLFGLAAVGCLGGAWRARHAVDRDTRVGLIAVFVLSGVWSLTTVVRLALPGVSLSLALRIAGLVVGLASVAAWLYFASAYAGFDSHRRTGVRSVATVAFGGIALGKLTAPMHHLYFTAAVASEPFPHLVFQPDVAYWLVAGVTYTLVGVGLFWLFEAVSDSQVDTTLFGAVLVLTAAPALLDIVLYLAALPPVVLEVSYAPLGMAIFALGTLAATDSEFRPVPQLWRQTVLRELAEAVLVVGSDGVVKHASPAAVELFPELAGAVGESFEENCPLLSDRSRAEASVFEHRHDGETRYYRTVERPLSAGDSVVGRAYVYTDVTESERTKQRLDRNRTELQRFRHAVESAGHAIFLTAPDGTIEYVNPAFEAITGYDREEAVGRQPTILNSGVMSDVFFEQLWRTIRDGRSWEDELVNRRKDGTLYHAHQTIAPVTDGTGEIDAFVAIQTDISDRKDREQQLRVLGRVLRHNIRNDMNVIRGRAELFSEGTVTDVADVCRQGGKIVEHCDKLLETTRKEQVITDVLLDSPSPEPVELCSLLGAVAADVHADHPEGNVSLDCPSTVQALAVDRLAIALEELLTNAIIHNEAASPAVSVTVTERPDVVDVAIRDGGPHIPDREQDVLAHGTTIGDLFHGTGLGLWVVYWIVKQSMGSVTVSTHEPAGNTVTITLKRPEQ